MRTARIIATDLYFHFDLAVIFEREGYRCSGMTYDRGLLPMANRKEAITMEAKRY